MVAVDGSVPQMLGVATDITQRKRAEEALRDSEGMLRQAQKMESIGTLAGGIAHDFNNLMTAVTGYSELVLRRMPEEEPLRSKVEEIRKAGERAASLTRQLLAFSRKQMLKPVVLNLNTVITGIGKMLPRLIGEDIELRFDLNASLGQVNADPGQIEQVLMNLVVNARDAMPAGGLLTVKTENVEFADRVGHHRMIVEPGRYVVLSVTDNGIGMDAETQSHIFEPFFTTKEVGKGTGLGLATVYGIVKQSGGSIWVYSEPREGTTFRIYLPRVDEGAATIDGESADQRLVGRGDETIWLWKMRYSARSRKEFCWNMATQSSGVEWKRGSEGQSRFAERIDLIVTDVVMPQMSGHELVENIRAARPETRVLYMSGFTDDAVVRHGVSAHELCFIQKPFSPESLAIKVREVLDNDVAPDGGVMTDSGFPGELNTYRDHPVN